MCMFANDIYANIYISSAVYLNCEDSSGFKFGIYCIYFPNFVRYVRDMYVIQLNTNIPFLMGK